MAPPGGQKPFPIGVAVEGSATGADIRVTGTTTRHLGWQWGWCDRMLLHLPLTTPQVEAVTDYRFLGDVQTVRFTSLRNDGDFSASIRGDSVVFNLPACRRHNSSHRSLRVIRCCVPIRDAEGTGSPLAGDCTRSQLPEVRLDAGKAARFTASAQSIDRFDRLLRTRCAIYRCPSRPKGRSWPHNRLESGECRLIEFVAGTDA